MHYISKPKATTLLKLMINITTVCMCVLLAYMWARMCVPRVFVHVCCVCYCISTDRNLTLSNTFLIAGICT